MAIRPRQKPTWYRITGLVCYGLLCIAAFAIGAGAWWASRSPNLWSMVLDRIGFAAPPPQKVFNSDSINLLVLGCDEDRVWGRSKPIRQKARSDMMLVAKLDFKANRISGVSIPRDTLVALPGYAEQKINGYHAIGARQSADMGKELAKRAVTYLLGVPIDRVVVIDYKALQDMVDLVGGVDIFVDKKMDYEDKAGQLHIHLKPGRQRLDGYRAMGYVRYRHSDSDLKRQERQKQFIIAFKEAVKHNIGQLPFVINKAVEALGGGLDDGEVNSLASFAMKIGGDNIKLGQIPVVDAPNYNLRVDQGRLNQTLAEYHLIDAPYPTSRVSYRR